MSNTEFVIRILSGAALFTLLLAAGLRLAPTEVWTSMRDWRRLVALLAVNFILVPAVTVVAVRVFEVPTPLALAMVLLSVAPFAPVVPVFTRLAKGNLALAAGLTAVFPVFCTFITPLSYRAAMYFLPPAGELKFQMLSILGTLLATATAPLALGVALNQLFPETSQRLIRPAEILSEAVGTVSLVFVVIAEFRAVFAIGWLPVVVMIVLSELCLILGYPLGGPDRKSRMVTGLGTSNRNIALSLLVAADSFPATAVVPGVVTNGLLLILLGLFHVGWWRFGLGARKAA